MTALPDLARNPKAIEGLAHFLGMQTWPEFTERAMCEKREVILNGGWRASKSKSATFPVNMGRFNRLVKIASIKRANS